MTRTNMRRGLELLLVAVTAFGAGQVASCRLPPRELLHNKQELRIFEEGGAVFEEKRLYERKYLGEFKPQSGSFGMHEHFDGFGTYWRPKMFKYEIYPRT